MGNIKGAATLSMLEYFRQMGGESGMEKIKAQLNPTDRIVFSKPIVPITWVDFGAHFRFMLIADKVLGKGDFQLVRGAAIFNAQRNLRGIYKIFISLTSPQFIIKNAGRLWSQMFDSGVLHAERMTEGSGMLVLTQFPNLPLNHEVANTPFMEEGMRLSGARNLKSTHPKCMARGDAHCEFSFTWDQV